MNAPVTAIFLAKLVWEVNERAEEMCLAAAMVGNAPTLEPGDLTDWRAVALEVFRAEGLPGISRYCLADRVRPILGGYAPTKESLAKALRLVTKRAERQRQASRALAALAELESALAFLRRP
jgi:hypothetical protein